MANSIFNNVLVPVNDSDLSGRVIERTVEMAKLGLITNVVIFNVWEYDEVDFTKLHSSEKYDELKTESERLLERYQAAIKEQGVETEILRAGGNPSNLIIEMVEKNNYDLIIMGSRKLNKFQEITYGSVSDRVTRLANCPILVIK